MELVNLVQGTPEWHHFRSQGLGGSDAPVLMGVSPYRTLEHLWIDKIGEAGEQVENYAMARGKRMEPIIVAKYEERYGMEGGQSACGIMGGVSHARASFDRLYPLQKCAIECKAPNVLDHAMAKDKIIPPKYLPQVHWNLMVGDLEYCDYVSYHPKDPDELAVVRIPNDSAAKDYQVEMIEKAHWFWEMVLSRTPVTDPVSENVLVLMQSYSDLKRHSNQVETELKAIKATLEKMIRDGDIKAAGYRAKWISKKGNVDYDLVPQLQGVNLEPFRKPASTYLDIRPVKGAE